MEMMIKAVFLILVGGIIGWVTNVIAIKLLFRPLRPIKILGIEFLGLIPKRRKDIARSIGETVHNELISMSEISDKLLTEENKMWILENILTEINKFISGKLGMLAMLLPAEKIEEMARKELPAYIDKFADDFANKAANQIDIGLMVEEKINEFPLEKTEEIILSIAKKELKAIEGLGGVLGCVIGFIQALIIVFF
ncbi:MAG: DUF445 domain-containing protein [Filifactoraceae bacterium]